MPPTTQKTRMEPDKPSFLNQLKAKAADAMVGAGMMPKKKEPLVTPKSIQDATIKNPNPRKRYPPKEVEKS